MGGLGYGWFLNSSIGRVMTLTLKYRRFERELTLLVALQGASSWKGIIRIQLVESLWSTVKVSSQLDLRFSQTREGVFRLGILRWGYPRQESRRLRGPKTRLGISTPNWSPDQGVAGPGGPWTERSSGVTRLILRLEAKAGSKTSG